VRPVRILVVEDESIVAEDIKETLEAMGYGVSAIASSGEDAVNRAIENTPDLVLMDIRLKGPMDGIEAAGQIRVRLDAPVIYLTAHTDEATLSRAKVTQPQGYLLKPFAADELRSTIEMALYKHEMEQKLRESERRFATTLRSIGDAVISTDRQQKISFMNPVAEAITGWKQQDALGRDVADVFRIISEDSRKARENPVAQVLQREKLVPLEDGTLLIARDGGEKPIDDSAAPIKDDRGQLTGVVLVFRDITQHRNLEEHLRATQKLEAIGRLAGGIAHDFNNLMTVVLTSCDMLTRMTAQALGGASASELIQAIRDAGERATSLTRQLLAYSRKQLLQVRVLNLNHLVTDVEKLFRRLLGESIEIVTVLESQLQHVKADPGQLQQVLLNLAVNARDAMPDGGRLSLTTANVSLDETYVRTHPEVTVGNFVRLTVHDTGHGMDEATLARVFEPFFTTKEVGKGSGLGLATVYGIVKQSGGHIDIDSRVGQGSTFEVYLPALPASEAWAELRPSSRELLQRGSETVLLVEDDEAVRTITTKLLQDQGFNVFAAASPDEALRAFDQANANVDLLVTDVIMPGMNGRDLAERLIGRRPDLKVLYVSGYNEEVMARYGIQGAETTFLSKPYLSVVFIDKVRELLDAAKQRGK
jgi:two-component system cell cycle sensor histidine kinase/response regulator CckA